MLEPATVQANGITTINIAGQVLEVVRVRLDGGAQQKLFLDPEALEKLQEQFLA